MLIVFYARCARRDPAPVELLVWAPTLVATSPGGLLHQLCYSTRCVPILRFLLNQVCSCITVLVLGRHSSSAHALTTIEEVLLQVCFCTSCAIRGVLLCKMCCYVPILVVLFHQVFSSTTFLLLHHQLCHSRCFYASCNTPSGVLLH